MPKKKMNVIVRCLICKSWQPNIQRNIIKTFDGSTKIEDIIKWALLKPRKNKDEQLDHIILIPEEIDQYD